MTTLRSGSATDIGKVRMTNQDVLLEETGLFAVADGMGGHAGGEVAARVAVDSLRATFLRARTVEGLRRAVAEANRAVWRQGQSESGLRGMGTTLTATALVEGPDGREVVALANVGDSRAYVYSRGQVIQVTADHSLAEERVRQGQLTEAEAAVHPQRHVLTRALGVSSDVDVDLWELHLHEGDRILLCSDGLTNEIGDERIGEILGTEADPCDAARILVKAAVDHGGSDNVTCVVIDVAGPGLAAGPAPDSEEEPAPAAGHGLTGSLGEGAFPGTAAEADEGAPDGNGVRARADPPGRTLRALGGSGGRARGSRDPGAAVPVAKKRTSATSVSFVGDRAGLVGGDTPKVERDGGTKGAAGRGSANVLAASRLQAAELRRLRSTRGSRRRRPRATGAPRLVTVRLVLFVVLLLGVVAGAYAALRWYAMDEWYVGIDHGHLAVYQGRPGGLLWFEPRLVDETSVTTHGVMPYRITQLRAHRQEPSLAAAKEYVRTLHEEYLETKSQSFGSAPPAKHAHHAGSGSAVPGTATSPSTSTAFSSPAGVWR